MTNIRVPGCSITWSSVQRQSRFFKIFLLFMTGLWLQFSCSPIPNQPKKIDDSPHPGMKKILSAGKSFQQGWNDTLASLDEKPGMTSSFTYDYWLDTVEVTQKLFYNLTGRKPVADTSSYGVGDDYPVYDVTWFGAALFCNARSKAEGLDTVYEYFGTSVLANGSVYELTGLRCDFTRDGYRLPTEAEWEFAARGGSSALPFSKAADSAGAADTAWYAADASDKTHPVASKRPNALGLYDLAGNVFEWTNDWKGPYDGKNIANSLGASQPGGDYEKVIKGGGYNYGLLYLRPSHRSATYATTLTSANEYVGFRCARGAIPGGSYIGVEQQNFTSNPVDLVADGAAVRAFTGASASKIVFVNVTGRYRTLCAVDFSATLPYVREFTDDKNVYVPTISPDGRFVAYCGSDEGLSGPSKITIRSLDSLGSPLVRLAPDTAYIPRWWVDRSTGDTCLVYTNSAVPNDLPLWKSTKTYVQKVSGGNPVGAPRVVVADGGYHDGLSADGGYAVTGYDRLMMRNLLTNEEKQLFLSPGNGKDANGSTQVCNVSMSPDTGQARCMFLDFGYPRTSTVTGTSYGIHQYLFVSTMTDSITTFMHCPDGEQSWDNPEWSNQIRFAVACGRNGADQSHAIYVVDLKMHPYRQVLAGQELQQPYLWIKAMMENPFNFALDSLGAYDDPLVEIGQMQFAYGLHYFWNCHNNIDLVFVGNSLMQAGIDCTVFKKYKAHNLGFSGCGLFGVSEIINDYIFNHASKVKIIGIIIPFYLFSQPLAENSPSWWSNSFCQSKGYLYDKNHNFWSDDLPQGFEETMATIPYPHLDGLDTFGLALWSCDGYGGPNPDLEGTTNWTVDDTNYLKNYNAYVDLIQSASTRKIHLIAINFPESPYYKTTDHYLRYGPSWETGRAIMAQMKTLESNYPYFHVYDAYQDGNHDYTDEDAHDFNHLCPNGAQKLTQRLDTLIQGILGK